MKEFNTGDKVYFYNGAIKVKCTVYKVNKVTVRVQTLAGQIITLPQNLVQHDEEVAK